MLSALFLINSKGEIVIYRLYRDDISLSAANQFRLQVRIEECLVLMCDFLDVSPAEGLNDDECALHIPSFHVLLASSSKCARAQVIAAKEAGSAAPVKNIDGNTFLYIRHKDMFFVAVSRTNANAGTSMRAHGTRGLHQL